MEIIIAIGAIISAISAVPYVRGVMKGTVKPKVVSWFTWCLLAVLLTGAALSSGQTMSAVMSSVTVMITAIVFFLGLRKGTLRLDKLDILCLAGAAIGIVVWLLLSNPALAIFVAVAVDIIAFIPTIVHGWVAPEEESLLSYGFASVGSGLGLFAVGFSGASASGLAYPMYATIFNTVMVLLLTRETWLMYLTALQPLKRNEETVVD